MCEQDLFWITGMEGCAFFLMLTPREWEIEEPSCTMTDTAQVGATVNSNVKVNSFVSEARFFDLTSSGLKPTTCLGTSSPRMGKISWRI